MTMKTKLRKLDAARFRRAARTQRGTAIIIAVMVMGLLALFVAASLARVTNESRIMSNDQANTASYFAAQASLEHMTRNFGDIFDVRLFPSTADLEYVRTNHPDGYDDDGFDLDQEITQVGNAVPTRVEASSEFAGLIALRTSWRLDATATGPTEAEVRLTRTLNNYLIPIFQFGIFYDDPMEHHPGPAFSFGGRVHTNGDIYMMAGTGLRFRDRVTAAGEVVTDVARNGFSYTHWGNNVYVKNNTGTFNKVDKGSVIGGPDTPERKAARGGDDPDLPDGTRNSGWTSYSTRFGGNLLARTRPLRLPLQIGNRSPIEIIKRGLGTDDSILRDSRYYNKPGIRITLGNSQADLPGGTGGVMLNGKDADHPNAANRVATGVRGYKPTTRLNGAQATMINGYRLTPVANRQVWIKVEIVDIDTTTLTPTTTEITEDILSLGMTDYVADIGITGGGSAGPTDFGDPDAIIKIQRFAIPGPPLKVPNANFFHNGSQSNAPSFTVSSDGNFFRFNFNPDGGNAVTRDALNRHVYTYYQPSASNWMQNFNVVAQQNAYIHANEAHFEYPRTGAPIRLPLVQAPWPSGPAPARAAANTRLIPFPIMMFDTREGLYNDDLSRTGGTSWQALYHSGSTGQRVPVNGVMGLIDFDVENFRRLVNGAFDGTLPNGLESSDIPDNGGDGWIVYVSDRRNDLDDDGEYDNENVYVPNAASATVTPITNRSMFARGEDVNHNGQFDVSYDNSGNGTGESATYNIALEADVAALMDTSWFRRASRLVNGSLLPGDADTGFSYSSENGVYIKGNYNATHVETGMSGGNPTPSTQYRNSRGAMVPSSVVCDAVSILSNQWTDGASFRWSYEFGPENLGGRRPSGQVTIRTALLMGDALSSDQNDGPTQGGGDPHMAGGVHNFKRFREAWEGETVNYCGSLINLYNSVGNNGPFKCCVHIYTPPTRNWVFDETFLDPETLPPGTPFFQYIDITGFRRTFAQAPTD